MKGMFTSKEIRTRLDDFVDIGAILEIVGRLPDRGALTRIVEECFTIASPHDTPSNNANDVHLQIKINAKLDKDIVCIRTKAISQPVKL